MAWFSKEHHKFLLGTQSHASRFGQFFGYNKIQNRIGHWIKIRLCEMQKSKHNLNHHLFHPKCSFFSFLDVNVEPHNLLSLHCKMFGTQKSTNTQKCGAHVTFSVLMSTKKPLMCTAVYIQTDIILGLPCTNIVSQGLLVFSSFYRLHPLH